ncbi:sterol carrier family protein [Streptomyces sp. NPDC051940]|uniref:maleylpyruvate isomerase family mycothiol-dependent enzyme n=1 Tax=Streptomyces sp. NPDC051940 TaxID=3155675 RepID=UPI003448B781
MPPAAKRKPRSYDPARTWKALNAQLAQVTSAARGLAAEDLAAPSGLPDWDVRLLLAHIVAQAEALPRALGEAPPPAARAQVGLSQWALSAAGESVRLDQDTRAEAVRIAGEFGGDAVAALDAAAERLAACEAEVLRPGRLVPCALGAMTASDYAVTRVVELVVHADDLARATGADVPHDRQALAATVRVLADALAVKAPGASVEVRIPPYAVVQCVEGPRHTRGTPPNVVETDPLTWLRLATGRTAWAEAREAARVSASGDRADIGGLLPVGSGIPAP